MIPYNKPNANIFQGFGWVKVTTDHTVHVTLRGTTSNTAVAHFYVQSTDGGATWTAPFQLSSHSTFAAFVDDRLRAMDVSGGSGAILAGWRPDRSLCAPRHVRAGHAHPDRDGHTGDGDVDAHGDADADATPTPCQSGVSRTAASKWVPFRRGVVRSPPRRLVVSSAQWLSGPLAAPSRPTWAVSGGETPGDGSLSTRDLHGAGRPAHAPSLVLSGHGRQYQLRLAGRVRDQ